MSHTQQSPTHALTTIFGDSAKVAILDALTDGEWMPSRHVVEATGYDQDILLIALADLEQMGVIKTATTAQGRSWKLHVEGHIGEHVARIAQEAQQ